ncbi:hypothetical protein FEM48_Zijuj09G0185300 [Ziziphus jujuba var. spinosa]|uniref:Uncharacterized protein n=1 Tax=Ziziphus jujuba var. spinosa TaxID=714518 RepID=A0A978UUL8_ZIZJJ|nr:hypothetical protein FEM48_Zijuj09G0185300 [Ziziphus jujuba var. spinosa]
MLGSPSYLSIDSRSSRSLAQVASAGPFTDSVRDLAGSLAASFQFETLRKEEIVEFIGVGGFELRKIIYYFSLQ